MNNTKNTDFMIKLLSLASMSAGFGMAKDHARVTLDANGNHVIDWTEAMHVLKEKMLAFTTHDSEAPITTGGLFS